jgi:hypothetical protein
VIGAAVAACCFAGWLVTARVLYSRWRGRVTGKRECPSHGRVDYREHYHTQGCCYDRTTVSDGEVAAEAMLAALAFPVLLLVVMVRWQPRLRRRRKLTEAEVAEIEREVGVGGK